MGQVRSHRDLDVWQLAMTMVLETYGVSTGLPATERFGLSSQMQRAAVSVPSNIAEGQARKSSRAFIYCIGVALGSLAELDTQLELAVRIGYVSAERTTQLQQSIGSVRRMLYGLRTAQRRRLLVAAGTSASILLLALRLIT